jgi:hypothetical protein
MKADPFWRNLCFKQHRFRLWRFIKTAADLMPVVVHGNQPIGRLPVGGGNGLNGGNGGASSSGSGGVGSGAGAGGSKRGVGGNTEGTASELAQTIFVYNQAPPAYVAFCFVLFFGVFLVSIWEFQQWLSLHSGVSTQLVRLECASFFNCNRLHSL